MEHYIKALESFERECDDVYADCLLNQFVATEGIGADLGAKIKAGWEKIWTAICRLVDFFAGVGRWVAAQAGKLINIIKKSPDESGVEESTANEASKKGEILDAAIDKIDAVADKFSDAVHSVMSGPVGDAVSDKIDQLNQLMDGLHGKLGGIGKKANESYVPATEGVGFKKINIKGIKEKLNKVTAKAKPLNDKLSKLIVEIKYFAMEQKAKAAEKKEAQNVDPAADTKRQKFISTALRHLASLGSFVKSVPSRVSSLFKELFPGRGEITIEHYDGPSPIIG